MPEEKAVSSRQKPVNQSQNALTCLSVTALSQTSDIDVAELQRRLYEAIKELYLVKEENLQFREDNNERLKAERLLLRQHCTRISEVLALLNIAYTSVKKENARLNKKCAKYKYLVNIDRLTGVYRREHMEDVLQKHISREVRAKRSWGVLMVDIDFFKTCNDTYGHAMGDKVLKNVAQKLQKISRAGDFVIRYGGEEFCIILFDIETEEKLKTAAERYRKAVFKTQTEIIVDNDKKYVSVTVSIGASFVPSDSSTELQSVIILADNALYVAKNSGRNCVVLYDNRNHS